MNDPPKCFDCKAVGAGVVPVQLRSQWGNAIRKGTGFNGRVCNLCLKCRKKRSGAYKRL